MIISTKAAQKECQYEINSLIQYVISCFGVWALHLHHMTMQDKNKSTTYINPSACSLFSINVDWLLIIELAQFGVMLENRTSSTILLCAEIFQHPKFNFTLP